jgi:hypothetical protein
MFGEHFLKPQTKEPQPSEAELALARKANEEADPTTYSSLPLTGDMNHGADIVDGRVITVGVHETGEYVELKERKLPKQQQAVARLVKGIIPVADIVSREDKPEMRYSKIMPLERIEELSSEAALHAYIEFMFLVFGDVDRREHGSKQHNYIHIDGKAVLFDFDGFDLSTMPLSVSPQLRSAHTVESLTKLSEALQAFEGRIVGEEGKAFVQSVLEGAGVEPGDLFSAQFRETTLEDLHELLVARTQRAQLVASSAVRDLKSEGELQAK